MTPIHFSNTLKICGLLTILALPFTWKPFVGLGILTAWIITHEYGHALGARMEGFQGSIQIFLAAGQFTPKNMTKPPGPCLILGGLCASLIFSLILALVAFTWEIHFLDLMVKLSFFSFFTNAVPLAIYTNNILVWRTDGAMFMGHVALKGWEPTKSLILTNLVGILASAFLILISTGVYSLIGLGYVCGGCVAVYAALFPQRINTRLAWARAHGCGRFSKLMSMSCFYDPKKL